MKSVVVVILLFLALSTSAHQTQASYYCGRDLSETLVKYCNMASPGKRSDSWMRTQLFGKGYWLTPHQAVAMGRGKRLEEGIATECCENPCAITELLAYCPE